MRLSKDIHNNIRFLLVEVAGQLARLDAYFGSEDATIAQELVDRSGYAYNLKQRIQNACMRQVARSKRADTVTYRAVASIASDLDRIAQLCRECLDQLGYLRDEHQLDLGAYGPLLRRVAKGIDLVDRALAGSDTRLALKLGRTEGKLEKSYKRLVDRYTDELRDEPGRPEDLVTGLFVARIIAEMGDALLHISESIISGHLGQEIDTARFHTLRDTIAAWLDEHAIDELGIQQLAETRSGSGIAAVRYTDADSRDLQAVFKEGKRRKLKEERAGVERWHEVFPGVAPQILTYQKQGDSAALLIEHLQGQTFEDLVLTGEDGLRQRGLDALTRTLTDIWTSTRRETVAPADFIGQTRKRLPEVFAVHPAFDRGEVGICGLTVLGLEQQLEQLAELEARYPPPFGVFIHGDFNVDNILYDQHEDRVRFIDLHRSCWADYVQDVSVFLVSNFRLQVLDRPVRRRIHEQICSFAGFAADFARRQGDEGFALRLALGLIRSFATSTRFILDRTLARRMQLTARYLADLVVARLDDDPRRLEVPIEELFRV